jgi:hypothetical protein
MSAQDDKRGVLWMFERRPRDGAERPGNGLADPDADLYRMFKNTRNPFLQRAIVPTAPRTERSERELSTLAGMLATGQPYHVGPANRAQPFQRRQLKHAPPPPAADTRYQEPGRLTANLGRLPLLVDEFFQNVLTRLAEDPDEFFAIVQELIARFRENEIRIRIYDAYHTLQDWDDLLDTLKEIARYPSQQTFDLFCSALFAYHDLVKPA